MLRLAVLSILAVLLSSCGGVKTPPRGVSTSARQQGDGDTVLVKYSSLLTIVRHDGYTEVKVRNPWKEGMLLHTYLLVPRHTELPASLPEGTVVRTPVKRAAVFTTVHCSLLNTLGHADDIVAVAEVKYIKIPKIQHRVSIGNVADCGSGMTPDVEKIIDVRPEIIMLSPFENSGGYGKLEDIGIPLIECAEYMETSPLARAEWMTFYGLLFGEQQLADSLFAVVDSSYQSLRGSGVETSQRGVSTRRRSVLIDKMVGSVWYVPGGNSTMGQMVKDAGGRYPWVADEHSGSLSLPFEAVLEQAGDADVWMLRYSGDRHLTRRQLLAEYPGYSQLKAFNNGEVYACNVDRTLFYEETPFRPDLLLADFIHILQRRPNVTSLRYYEKIDE